MGKKRVFRLIVAIIVLFGGLNLFLFFNKRGLSYSSVSGKFIDKIPRPLSLNLSLILFILGWIILLLLAFNAYRRFLRHKSEDVSKGMFQISDYKKTRSETDLDILYRVLKEKKSLSVGAISKTFKISKEKALEWARILEDHEIVTTEYPAFYDPEVKINEKEVKEERKPEEDKKIKRKEVSQKEKGQEVQNRENKTEAPEKRKTQTIKGRK